MTIGPSTRTLRKRLLNLEAARGIKHGCNRELEELEIEREILFFEIEADRRLDEIAKSQHRQMVFGGAVETTPERLVSQKQHRLDQIAARRVYIDELERALKINRSASPSQESQSCALVRV